ncbi:hypothetical protein KAFR_0C04990 [Kazachstania africana CBS 2517]|uniref:Dienelactone hydrolase domain-containing protein n=1 Tax=Kazachstania africana (strain ATCC 22294 / BCRC 22015 / CBS 2517 / CECT 1963 / NBRC 1671 / NRRL Y-8276) TaxID=1071382 RepID=H2ASZ0_KAZAF|nr:hypothetical protein KAFR_0C04990 [Kazachstania africana CBS 2517]CCF57490.1 hypothetical protein KAFR_0C04990 [Kazachstania africana CBS 2517]
MASNPPGKCCFEGFYHEGTAKGKHEEIFGLDTYVTGTTSPSDRVIVILTDVYGNKINNALLIADQLARPGYKVYIPDILFGDVVVKLDGSTDFNAWRERHSPEKTRKVVDEFMSSLKKEYNPKFIGVIGYCFGAKFAVQQINTDGGFADVAAIAHPSFVSMEEVAAIEKPLLIAAAENDSIFPEENRHATEAKLKEIGARYQLDLFGGVQHGFAARGDVSDPVVKYAKEKALSDQIYWFDHFSK